MTALSELADQLGDEKAIEIAVTQFGMTPDYARFVIAMGRGQVDGDVIESEGTPDEQRDEGVS